MRFAVVDFPTCLGPRSVWTLRGHGLLRADLIGVRFGCSSDFPRLTLEYGTTAKDVQQRHHPRYLFFTSAPRCHSLKAELEAGPAPGTRPWASPPGGAFSLLLNAVAFPLVEGRGPWTQMPPTRSC